ncbi:MAG: hypothetical protein AMDU5_GPLC00016G0001, partial [Thermoplasmatales archaeon Gpl]
MVEDAYAFFTNGPFNEFPLHPDSFHGKAVYGSYIGDLHVKGRRYEVTEIHDLVGSASGNDDLVPGRVPASPDDPDIVL